MMALSFGKEIFEIIQVIKKTNDSKLNGQRDFFVERISGVEIHVPM